MGKDSGRGEEIRVEGTVWNRKQALGRLRKLMTTEKDLVNICFRPIFINLQQSRF